MIHPSSKHSDYSEAVLPARFANSSPVTVVPEMLMVQFPYGPTSASIVRNNDHEKPHISRKRFRTVQFSDSRVVGIVAHHASLTAEQVGQIWFGKSELDLFKSEARSLCRQLRHRKKAADENEPLPRGLEQRICRQRQRSRYLAIRCVLKAQQRSRCPDFISMISRKCTRWASDVAHIEAQHDYCDVYQPQMKMLLPQVKELQIYELPTHPKRNVNSYVKRSSVDMQSEEGGSDSDKDSVEAAQRNVRSRRA